jgi:hypothetical protein
VRLLVEVLKETTRVTFNNDGGFDMELTHARITPDFMSRSSREIARDYV